MRMGDTTEMTEQPPHVCILGLGYIGLPTAAVIARAGLTVHGVDTSATVIDTINRGCIHIEEPGLETLVRDMVGAGRITASTRPTPADVFLIAVPTPSDEAHRPDLSAVEAATRSLAPVLVPGNLVVLESTCPIGTTERVRDLLAAARPELRWPRLSDAPDIHIAYCPERVLPGRVLQELVANSRSIGGLDNASSTAARDFYRRFVAGECVGTTARTAEMVKLMENASRDVGIAFANELSLVAERVGVDVWEAIALANRHPRVNILKPGPGVGGHCIAVDPWFLVAAAPELTPLMQTARAVNDGKARHVLDRAAALLDRHPEAWLACLGLTFKPDVDDLRESPALAIATALARTVSAIGFGWSIPTSRRCLPTCRRHGQPSSSRWTRPWPTVRSGLCSWTMPNFTASAGHVSWRSMIAAASGATAETGRRPCRTGPASREETRRSITACCILCGSWRVEATDTVSQLERT